MCVLRLHHLARPMFPKCLTYAKCPIECAPGRVAQSAINGYPNGNAMGTMRETGTPVSVRILGSHASAAGANKVVKVTVTRCGPISGSNYKTIHKYAFEVQPW